MTRALISEADWQATVTDLAAVHGWRVFHARPARTARGWATPVAYDGAGFPDLVLVRERVVFAELKSHRGKVTGDQQAWLDSLGRGGAEVYVWRPDDFEEVREVLAP